MSVAASFGILVAASSLWSFLADSDVRKNGEANFEFVRDVKAAPDPQCILFFDWQIADMEKFVIDTSEQHGILTIDPTYNLGQSRII